ncbi:hypothetical protein RCC89_00415 [Cytophagaceae bacterium ABcell3]|nr:hypothetical protein RCC89_00415 [Cytophagaceae bacterium ABcell3]
MGNIQEPGVAEYEVNDKAYEGLCDCDLENGVLSISINYDGVFVNESINISVGDSNFYAIYNHAGDIEPERFTAYPIKQELKLNLSDFSVGDTIVGELVFKGISIVEYLKDIKKLNLPIRGNFSCIIGKKEKR